MRFCLLLLVLNSWAWALGPQNPIMQAKKFTPTREYSIIVGQEGYFPKHLSLFEGERLRLFLTSTTAEEGCLIIPEHNLFLAAHQGSISAGEVTFTVAGSYPFHCPSKKSFNGKIMGTITVLKKPNEPSRAPTVISKGTRPWMPRED